MLVAITGAPGTEALIRRAARMAQRSHGELLGVHVRSDDGLTGSGRSDAVERHRQLLTDLGGEFHEVVASDIAAALAELARVENCTQLVLGASRRSRWAELTRGSVINRVIRLSGPDRPARDLAGRRTTDAPATIARRAAGSSGARRRSRLAAGSPGSRSR